MAEKFLATQTYVKDKTMHENRTQKVKNKSKIKVIFAKPFGRKPQLEITIYANNVDFDLTAHTKTGFMIEFFDSNGAVLSYSGRYKYEAKPLNLD